MDKQREGFEKAYEPNPNKSPFTEVKFDEVARVYKPLDQFNPRIASSLNAAWYGWRIRQAEVDGLQAKVEGLQKRLYGALKETQYALQYVEGDMRGNHEFLQMAMIRTFKALEQVLKGEGQ